MRILVVGGAGYIGSHVVKELLNTGYDVRVFDNLSTGQEINLFEKAEFIQGDILDVPALEKAMQGIDGVVHLAAKKAVGESMEKPDLYALNNLNGTINVLNAMVKEGVKYFVFSSTAAVYGMPEVEVLDEQTPLNPINFYGFSKKMIEDVLSWYDKLKGIKFVALRYFNAVGYDKDGQVKGLEKNPQNLLPIIMETIFGVRDKMTVFGSDYPTKDGTCVRDYIHVSDLASAHELAFKYLLKSNESQVMNLGTGSGHSVKEMIETTQAVTKKKVAYEMGARRTGDPAALMAYSEKAKELLGWQPKHSSLENIIESTYRIYQKYF
ncbi:MAG: UDP-glucose 4-epimerase GalE [Alphaproteobacteria bacterium]|nr:UDP-glucose 4-epimerase GalE [Alphaproteobacteria bacterium]